MFDSNIVITPDIFATQAAESLAALHSVSSTSQISLLLKKLHDTNSPPVLQNRTALALLSLGGPQTEIIKVMGSRWLAQEAAKRQLRLLPDYLLPVAPVPTAE